MNCMIRRLITRKPSCRLFSSTIVHPPVIDIAPFLQNPNSEQAQQTKHNILHASKEFGFFYIEGHGIHPTIIDSTFQQMKHFFQLPEEVKRKSHCSVTGEFKGYIGKFEQGNYGVDETDLRTIHVDGEEEENDIEQMDNKEVFHIGTELKPDHPEFDALFYGPNVWPENQPEFRSSLTTYYDSVLHLTDDLFRLFAFDLGLPNDFFQDKIENGMNTCNFVHYPPATNPDKRSIGIHAHTDFECFTVLAQHGCTEPCLEIFKQDTETTGHWVGVPPIEHTFVVNIGDMLARWSNGNLRSAVHRARNPKERSDRYSIAFFRACNSNVLLENLMDDECAKYKPILAGKHLKQRIEGANVNV